MSLGQPVNWGSPSQSPAAQPEYFRYQGQGYVRMGDGQILTKENYLSRQSALQQQAWIDAANRYDPAEPTQMAQRAMASQPYRSPTTNQPVSRQQFFAEHSQLDAQARTRYAASYQQQLANAGSAWDTPLPRGVTVEMIPTGGGAFAPAPAQGGALAVPTRTVAPVGEALRQPINRNVKPPGQPLLSRPEALASAGQGALYGGGAAAGAWIGGAGFWEGTGAGIGGTIGGIGGALGGAALGGAAGGAVGTIPAPIVGTVSGAAVGGYLGGGIGGGLGAGVGSSLGGGLGRLIDDLIPDFFGGPDEYPNEFDPAAMDAGSIVNYGEPPPFTGGQSDGVCYLVNVSSSGGATTVFRARGPIGGVRTVTISGGGRLEVFSRSFPNPGTGTTCQALAGAGWYFTGAGGSVWNADKTASITSIARVDGQPDTGGDPPGGTDSVRAPNPARQPADTTPRPLPPPVSQPTPTPSDPPWPGTDPQSVPDTTPLAPPDSVPNFSPTPTSDPESPTAPDSTPTDLESPRETAPRLSPTIIPIVIGAGAGIGLAARSGSLGGGSPFLSPVNRSNSTGLVATPVKIPSGSEQPVITPSGPQIGTPPSENPNVDLNTPPVEQAPSLSNNCCIPPANPDIIKRLEQIKTGIGFDGMPVSVPDQIAKDNPGQLMIGSLAELHLWQVQQLDGVLGKWPVGIPIPTPAGTTTVGMPNVAEAVAEMVGMLVSQQVTAAQILNTSSRAMVQAGSATQQAHLAHLVAKANADFLGYENRPNSVDMPLTYTPGKDLSDGLLSESTAKIKGFENTDNTDIKAIFAELLQAAAIIRAVYWRKLDPKGDLKTQLRQNIRGQGDFVDQAAAGDGNDSDWEAYLKQVEEGFRGSTGDANPYGRPPTEGPQIKDRSPGEGNT
ncbi:hypothetical protein VB780_01985 [Leptolyngbya sp. CCNP1308]|uniref:hypothetical protein n=1 Tax=Leptolyngbya sp. CCNP1308 TaxID=3110255 RepID=UPI002B1E9D9B|nr:hypothetical protein [Leptolyngbya sp. CCNP1308]MEA5447320.1 hypothetical protein [Leptolyngbya sp. CCNP1308]